MKLAVDPQRMLADLKHLASYGRVDGGVNRRALTPIDLEARQWLVARMQDAGLDAQIDGVGNVTGRTPHPRRILIGSHTDTVPNGGWLDGSLGVVYGLEIARTAQAVPGEIGVEVISLSDEEGHFTPLLGSQAFCAGLTPGLHDEKRNSSGQLLADVLAQLGLAGRAVARLDPAVHVAYLEAHIEQGPVLEHSRIDIGVVTHIVGLREYRVVFRGEANHAGTTPMNMRRNASSALLRFGARLDRACQALQHPNTVWNIGRLLSEPPASNVVPFLASCAVQFRSTDEAILDVISDLVANEAASAAAVFNAAWSTTPTLHVPATPMDSALAAEIELAAHDLQATTLRMPSGAGHDAMVFAAHVPTAMLFIPTERGVSHSTAESSPESSLTQGLQVLARAVERMTGASSQSG